MHLASAPEVDVSQPLQFVVNAASGRHDADDTRRMIEAALDAAGRRGDLLFAGKGELAQIAHAAAATARSVGSAVVAVGGDGTINALAQAAHAKGCAMGVIPLGTFNYFSRTHHLPTEPAEAAASLLRCGPVPVQVGLVNNRVFLVNASLGIYPELLQDREAYKARFGRSRWVAWLASLATLTRAHRQLRLRVELPGGTRAVQTPTLFVGNNRLQLEQVGLPEASALDNGCLAAVMLRPIGSWALLWLMVRGSMGRLGEADTVESFDFRRIVVSPRLAWGGRRVKVACDGEVGWMRMPLEFRVAPQPLYLLKPLPTPLPTPLPKPNDGAESDATGVPDAAPVRSPGI